MPAQWIYRGAATRRLVHKNGGKACGRMSEAPELAKLFANAECLCIRQFQIECSGDVKTKTGLAARSRLQVGGADGTRTRDPRRDRPVF
jgi:hypothetical protein